MARSKQPIPGAPGPRPAHAERLLSFVSTNAFARRWDALGLTDDDMRTVEKAILADPRANEVMRGTGALRKYRHAPARSGRGQSGGIRVCYALFPEAGRILLVAVYGKNQADNLTRQEQNAIKKLLDAYRAEPERKKGGDG